MTCWAVSLGDCDDKISREHIVSKSLYIGDMVKVSGFPWCKDEPKTIGLANLTAKILCKRHNSLLSEVDTAGAFAFDVLRQSQGLSNIRNRNPKTRWTIKRYKIDGPRLERWFLKTLININLSFGGSLRIGTDSTEIGKPSLSVVETAFGVRKFQNRAGLYSVVRVGQTRTSEDTVSFAPLIKDSAYIAGGLWSFRGFVYLLFLGAEGPPQPLVGVSFDGEDFGACQLNFHNRQARMNVGKYLSQVIETVW